MSESTIDNVEYDASNCRGARNIVCPYCGNEHTSDVEDYKNQDYTEMYECTKCEKHFVYEAVYTVTFDTMPIENHYNQRREKLLHIRKKYEGIYNPEPHIQASINNIDYRLRELEEEKNTYLNE